MVVGDKMYANVIVEIGVKSVDRYFIYKIPPKFSDLKVGMRVVVSFGRQLLEGFVMEILDNYDSNYELKEILEVVDSEPILNKEMLKLGKIIADTTLCSLISAYQVMLPKALKASYKTNMKAKMARFLVLNKTIKEVSDYIEVCKYEKQQEILEKVIIEDKVRINSLNSTINTLIKKGLIKIIEEEEARYEVSSFINDVEVSLNVEQQKAVDEVVSNLDKSITYLLYGVTGSGKTEVYMNIIKNVIEQGKTAIMLVPEISLTPQIISKFVARFKNNIAVLHSGLSDPEKYDEYRKILNGEVNIVIGARSAVFAPLYNLGVIIIDEEHSPSYKQDNNPRYNAIDVAIERSKYNSCPVILGSATPSLESFAKAGNKVYNLLTLTKRAGNSLLPKIHIIDMKEEVKKNNFIFSEILKQKIEEKVKKNEQVILLLNRRGYSSMLTCKQCGYIEKCPNCDISLTYHKTSNMLRCHYCSYSKKKIDLCPTCGNSDIKDYGLGTQKLEEEVRKMYPYAKIIRMDTDTTYKKGAHEQITKDFLEHKYDILIGTQMIAKGLDFPLVTLVGVINADSSLNIPDFRSSEKTYQLLSQVSGRAGRAGLLGEVVIQTYNPNHYSIKYASLHNYLGFYKEEMKIRKILGYSPYYYITVVKISCKDFDLGFKHANKIGDYLRKNVDKNTIILGPTMANMFKINNIYNYQCIIKYRKDEKLMKVLKAIDEHYKNEPKVDVAIDVNPTKL